MAQFVDLSVLRDGCSNEKKIIVFFLEGEEHLEIFFKLCKCLAPLKFYFYVLNAYNIKFAILTIFKYTIQWHQLHSQCCVTITTISKCFHHLKQKLYS